MHSLTKNNPERKHLYALLDAGKLTGGEYPNILHDRMPRLKKYPKNNFATCFKNTVTDWRSQQLQGGDDTGMFFITYLQL